MRPVHRLDRDTSGLMVFARSSLAERHLAGQFRRHTTQRRYLAVALGDVPARTIESRLIRDRGDGRRGSTTSTELGKHAVTHVRPIERFSGYTLVECRLETGRTHQIRVHMQHIGAPMVGDPVYGLRGIVPNQAITPTLREALKGFKRQALHAVRLGLIHPATGEAVEWHADLPADMKALLEAMRYEEAPDEEAFEMAYEDDFDDDFEDEFEDEE